MKETVSSNNNFSSTTLFSLYLSYGFALFLTWVYGFLFAYPLDTVSFEVSLVSTFGIHACGLSGFALGILISAPLSNRAVTPLSKRVLLGISILFLVVYTWASVFQGSSLFFSLLTVIVGCFTGYFFCIWLRILTAFMTSLTPYLWGLSAILGLLVGYFFTTLSQPTNTVCFILAFCLSITVLAYFYKHHSDDSYQTISDEKLPISRKMTLQFSVYGLLFGVSSYYLCINGTIQGVTVAIVAGTLLASLDMRKSNGVNMQRSRTVISVGSMIILLVAAVMWPEAQVICWTSMGALFAYTFIVNANWVMLSAREHKQSVILLYSRTQAGFWICLACGWVVAWLVRLTGLSTVLTICSLLCLVAVSSLLMSLSDLDSFESVYVKEDMFGKTSKVRYFGQACNVIAEEHGLTPREAEVFALLAKGRNAQVISDDLVISRYTAKTHIYHIYQKTGKNSQQDLIDMVETYTYREPRSA